MAMNLIVGEPKIGVDKSSELARFVCSGNDAVEFKLVHNAKELEDCPKGFHPEMCHQVFSEGETIFGYENLKIEVLLAAGSLNTYLGIKHKRQISKGLSDGLEPDDIVGKMNEVLRGGYTKSLDEFSKTVEKDELGFRPMGELIHSVSKKFIPKVEIKKGGSGAVVNGAVQNGGGEKTRTFELYVVDAVKTPKFLDYLKKAEAFLLFFIDAGSFVECEGEEKWKFFTLYEKYKTSEGNSAYAFIGYSSVHQFYVYPDKIRPRIAQMLVLPPFQKQGLAVEIMSSIYTYYRSNPKVLEMTVEDPSDEFELLRDYVDARDCKKLSSYGKEKLLIGFSKEMQEESHNTLKITKRQAHRIYEILRLQVTNVHDEKAFKDYRVDVKRRLNIPYQKQHADIKRMQKRKCYDPELHKASVLDDGTRKTELESNFQLLLTHYNNVLARMDKFDC